MYDGRGTRPSHCPPRSNGDDRQQTRGHHNGLCAHEQHPLLWGVQILGQPHGSGRNLCGFWDTHSHALRARNNRPLGPRGTRLYGWRKAHADQRQQMHVHVGRFDFHHDGRHLNENHLMTVSNLKIFSERVVLPTFDGGLEIQAACVTIQGDKIQSVSTGDDALALRSSAEDLGDSLLSPAFINTHTHLSLSCLRGIGRLDRMRSNVVEEVFFRVESKLEPGDIRAFVRMGAYESLCSGTGTVWDHYYGGIEVAEALVEVGLTGVVAPTLQDLSGPGVSSLEAQIQATEALSSESKWKEQGIVAALGPHATDTVSDTLWKQIGELARQLHIPIHAHVAQHIEEVQRSFSLHGCGPLTRLDRLGLLNDELTFLIVHALFVSDAELDRLHPETNILGHCPYSQAQFAFPAPISSWMKRGLKVAIGTDCGACNDTMNVQQELRLVADGPSLGGTWSTERSDSESAGTLDAYQALQEKRIGLFDQTSGQLGTEALLRCIWSTPGDLHPALPVGQIAPGHLANLVIWNLDHPGLWPAPDPLRALAFSDAAPAIQQMMIRGKWKGERGNYSNSLLNTPEFQAHKAEANTRLEALLKRAL
jgi:5-methylthioadenosine/S-adenosylhomocysteine deaminase